MVTLLQLAEMQARHEAIVKAANACLAKIGAEAQDHAAKASAGFAMAQELALAINAGAAQLEAITLAMRAQYEAEGKLTASEASPGAADPLAPP